MKMPDYEHLIRGERRGMCDSLSFLFPYYNKFIIIVIGRKYQLHFELS